MSVPRTDRGMHEDAMRARRERLLELRYSGGNTSLEEDELKRLNAVLDAPPCDPVRRVTKERIARHLEEQRRTGKGRPV